MVRPIGIGAWKEPDLIRNMSSLHMSEGHIQAPRTIEFSNITFKTVSTVKDDPTTVTERIWIRREQSVVGKLQAAFFKVRPRPLANSH